MFRARYSEALEYFSESLRERKKTGTEEEISIVLHNIGIVFYKMKLYQKGLEYLEESLRLKTKIKHAHDLGPLKIDLGLCKIFLKRYQEGLSDIRRGMEMHDHRPGVQAKVSGLYALGVGFYEMENWTQAEHFFRNSYRIARENNLKRFRADNLVYLARLAAIRHDFANGIALLNEAEDVIRLSDYDELSLTIYGDFIRLYAADPEKLKEYQNRYIGLRQRVYNTELAGRMQQFQEDLARDEHEAGISLQQRLVHTNGQVIHLRNVALGTTALALVLLSVVVWSSLRYNAQKRTFNTDLINTVKIRSLALEYALKETLGKSEIQRVRLRNLNQIVSTYRTRLDALSVGMIRHGRSNGMKVKEVISRLFEDFP